MSTETTDKPIEGWLAEARKEHRILFSELEVLLKALDRYFIMENHPASRAKYSSKSLHKELIAVSDCIHRIIAIVELAMPETNRNAYWFQKFAESKLLDNRKREAMRAGMYKQDSEEKSFYVLYDSFINLKSLVADILRNQDIAYLSFKNIGQLISKEIRENHFFNPFRLDINPEFDYIDNKEISEMARQIEDREMKKTVSILFLHLFRLIRYLNTMDHRSLNKASINCSLIIFTLLKSEIEVFRVYVSRVSGKVKDDKLSSMIQSLSYQIGMESKRVFMQEMKDIYEKESEVQLRGKIEASRGILKNLVEQSVIQLARYWNPNIKGEAIFEVFITKAAQSMKLREDIYVLNRLVAESLKKDSTSGHLSTLINYMDYYENFTFKLLRFDDYEQFSNMFTKIRTAYQRGDRDKLAEACHEFNIFLDTTLRQIDNRADLKGRRLDKARAEDIVRQYLANI